MRRRAQVMFLLWLVAAPNLLAQEDSCLRRTVPVNITTEAGYPIQDLTGITLTGEFRGKPVKILSLKPSQQPPRIIIVLDRSRSLGRTEWTVAVKLARDLVQLAPPEAQLGLVVFGDTVYQEARPELGRTTIPQHLDTLPGPKGQTALRDAILRALQLLGTPQAGDAIFAITDGDDTSSRASWENVAGALVAVRARLFSAAVKFSNTAVLTTGQLGGQDELREAVRATGGNLWQVVGKEYTWDQVEKEGLKVFAVRLYRQIADVRWLEVELPEPVDKPRTWKLEMKQEKGSKAKGLQIFYSQKLLPCATGK